MLNSTISVTLDLQNPNDLIIIDVQQGDTARVLDISLNDGGFPYQLTEDCYAVYAAIKPDKNTIYNNCQIADGKIQYKFTDQDTAVAGRVLAEIKIYGGEGQILTTAFFGVAVHGSVFDSGQAESSAQFSALDDLVSRAMEFLGKTYTKDETDAIVQEIYDSFPKQIMEALKEAKESGEFDGAPGKDGEPGPIPTLEVGNVTTGEPGSEATVELEATETGYRMNASIPRGADGDMPTLGIGKVSVGTAAASITKSGDGYLLNLTMPSVDPDEIEQIRSQIENLITIEDTDLWIPEYQDMANYVEEYWRQHGGGGGGGSVPTAGTDVAGVVMVDTNLGTAMSGAKIRTVPANNSVIDTGRKSTSGAGYYRPITPAYLDYAVRAALCDGIGDAWDSAAQLACQKRIGVDSRVEKLENELAGVSALADEISEVVG